MKKQPNLAMSPFNRSFKVFCSKLSVNKFLLQIMLSLPQIEEKVSRLSLSKKHRELAVNIFCLLNNVKPGILWDFGNVDIKKLLSIKSLISDLIIVVLELDFFIASKCLLLKSLKKMSESPPYFINISRKLTEPEPVSADVGREQARTVRSLINQITEATDNVVTVNLEASWNLCSIFGILLGFPVVYYFDQQDGNCLDNVDLALYKLQVDNFSPISFSIPTSLETAASDQISSWETEAAERCEKEKESVLRVTRQIVNLAVVVL